MGQRTLATSFAAWSDHMHHMRAAKQAMQQVAARMTSGQLAAAFYTWQEAAQRQQQAMMTAHKLMLRCQQASQARTAVEQVLLLLTCSCAQKVPMCRTIQFAARGSEFSVL